MARNTQPVHSLNRFDRFAEAVSRLVSQGEQLRDDIESLHESIELERRVPPAASD
jgi:hypothetical protein